MKTTPHLLQQLAVSCKVITAVLIYSAIQGVQAADREWDGGGGDNYWQTGPNWMGDIAPAANDVLIFTNTVRLNNTNNFTAGTAFGGIAFNSPAGAFILNGNPITLGGDIADSQEVTLQTINLPLILNATRNVNVVSNGFLMLGGVISGAGNGLTKTGGGRLTFSAANTFTGPVIINAGSVNVTSDANLGAAPGAPAPGRLAINGGTLRAGASFTLIANRGIALGPNAGTFDVPISTTLTYGGIIANNGGIGSLSKVSFGGLTLSGPSTYTGSTAIKNGTLTLDFTQAGSPANNVISSSSFLSLGGATAGQGTVNNSTLIMDPKANTVNSQTFNNTRIDFGPAVIRANSNNLSTANLNLGAVTHNSGGVVNFVPPTLRGGQGRITTASPNVNGILGGWATISDGTISTGWTRATNWASVDGGGNIVNYTGHTVYSSGLAKDIMSPANNIVIPDGTTDVAVDVNDAGSTLDVNTIIFDRNAAWTFQIGRGNTIRLGKTGALFNRLSVAGPTWVIGGGAAGGTGTPGDGGRITAGGPDPDTPGEVIFINTTTGSGSGNNWNIDAQIVDNGAGAVTVVKAGSGYIKLRNTNAFSGGLYLLGGRVQLAGSDLGTPNPSGVGSGPIYVFPGAYLYLNPSPGTLTNAAFIAGTGTPQETGLGGMRLANGAVYAGPIELIGDARLCGQNNNNGGNFSGPISGSFNLVLGNRSSINGNVTLSNPNNSWSGNTILEARNNTGNNNFINGASDVIPSGFGKGNVVLDGQPVGTITWNLNGFNETINGLTHSGTAASCIILNNVGSTTSTLAIGDNDQSGTFGGVIQNGATGAGVVALTKIGGGKQTLTGINTYSGPTTISGGTLALSGSGSISSSGQILVDGGALDVSEVSGGFTHGFPVSITNGTVIVRSTVSPGISSLSLTDARVRVVSLGGAPIVVETTSLSTGGPTNFIDIASVAAVAGYPIQFTVIKYAGFIDGVGFNFALGNVPTSSTVGYVSNNVDNASVDLVLLDGPKTLTWTGMNGNNWDIDTTTNWLAFGLTLSVYLDVDSVRFDDTASSSTVNLTTTLQPGSVVVQNDALTYTFTGPGKISGPSGLTKQGNGTLILDNSGINDFSDALAINAGTLQVGNSTPNGSLGAGTVVNNAALTFARSDNATFGNVISGAGTVTQNGPGVLTLNGNSTYTGPTVVAQSTLKPGSATAFGASDNGTTVNSGATLDINGQNLTGEPVTVSGAGVGGNGAIVNSGADQLNALRTMTLAGNVTFGGTGRWDIRTNAAGPASLSSGGQPFKITKIGSNQVSLAAVGIIDPALGDIDVQQGIFGVQSTTTQVGDANATLTVQSGATLNVFNLNPTGLNKKIELKDGATLWNENGVSIVAGSVALEGDVVINAASAGTTPSLTLSGEIGGAGNLIKIGSGPLILSGAFNAYAGTTAISNGMLLVQGNHEVAGAYTVYGGTLGGNGSINSPTVVTAAGTLAPGNLATAIGTLGIANTLSLAGTTAMDVSRTGFTLSNDRVIGVTTLTLGGTLRLTLTGDPLLEGDVFDLFDFESATGTFGNITPARPGPNLAWDTSQLAVDGTLSVVAAVRPGFGGISLSGTNVVLSGTNGMAGATYYVLTSTNIGLPLTNWTRLVTNLFDGSGNFNYTNAIDPNTPQRFYLLQVP